MLIDFEVFGALVGVAICGLLEISVSDCCCACTETFFESESGGVGGGAGCLLEDEAPKSNDRFDEDKYV